MLETS